jgi:hypothetical protein
MIKQLFTALTGITEDIDSDESQASWERRRYADENDLDNDFYNDDDASYQADDDTGDEPENVKQRLGWFSL